jgi:hypothetical protein
MVPARLACALVFAFACASHPATDAAEMLNGVVVNVDMIHETITLSTGTGDKPTQNEIHFNTLTVVDTPYGSFHVDQLQFGTSVLIHGRRDLATGEITADRIVVVAGPVR